MKLAYIELFGKKQPLAMSVGVIKAITERYGGVDKIESALSDKTKALDEALWLLSVMNKGAVSYCKKSGIDCPKAFSLDDIYDLCDMNDLKGLVGKIKDSIAETSTPAVEVKNAETTQAQAKA